MHMRLFRRDAGQFTVMLHQLVQAPPGNRMMVARGEQRARRDPPCAQPGAQCLLLGLSDVILARVRSFEAPDKEPSHIRPVVRGLEQSQFGSAQAAVVCQAEQSAIADRGDHAKQAVNFLRGQVLRQWFRSALHASLLKPAPGRDVCSTRGLPIYIQGCVPYTSLQTPPERIQTVQKPFPNKGLPGAVTSRGMFARTSARDPDLRYADRILWFRLRLRQCERLACKLREPRIQPVEPPVRFGSEFGQQCLKAVISRIDHEMLPAAGA